MLRSRSVALALALAVPATLAAQEILLESPDDILGPCSWLHKADCSWTHIEFETKLSVGAAIRLDGVPYVVTRMNPGYYLDSGVVLEPGDEGVPGLVGQRWVEVYPQAGRLHISAAWKDLDSNQALSRHDTLTLDTGQLRVVKDVRLLLRAKPASKLP